MWYFVFALIGVFGGGYCVYVLTEKKRKELGERQQYLETKAAQVQESQEAVSTAQNELETKAKQLQVLEQRIEERHRHFDRRVVSYDELSHENALLKQDLRNVAVQIRKLQMDREAQRCDQTSLDERSVALAARYLKDNVKWISASLTPNNYAASKERLKDVIGRCRSIGFSISEDEEQRLLTELKHEYEMVLRVALEREEQARIRAQIREEKAREREIERAKRDAERERQLIEAALAEALAKTHDVHSAEVERLKAELAEAEAKAQRAISQAQLTKTGNIYVISNIGSFGEGVFKVGMTRRLDPEDRIRELGDASVPFPFDIHMMIAAGDAPALELALHRALHLSRVNRANPRKEFFRTTIDTIYQIVKDHHGEVKYVADAEALEYQQSLTMSAEDQEFIEHVFEDAGALEEEEEQESVEGGVA